MPIFFMGGSFRMEEDQLYGYEAVVFDYGENKVLSHKDPFIYSTEHFSASMPKDILNQKKSWHFLELLEKTLQWDSIKIIWEDKTAPWNIGLNYAGKVSEQSRLFIQGFLSGYSDTINSLHAVGTNSDNKEFVHGYRCGKQYGKLGGEHIVCSMIEKSMQ